MLVSSDVIQKELDQKIALRLSGNDDVFPCLPGQAGSVELAGLWSLNACGEHPWLAGQPAGEYSHMLDWLCAHKTTMAHNK